MRLRHTLRGRAALAALAVAFASAVLLGNYALAALGVALTLAYAHLRWAFREGLDALELAPQRRILEPVLYADAPATVEATLVGRNPARLHLTLEDAPPPGWRTLDAPRAEAPEWGAFPEARYACRPAGRGSWLFSTMRVVARDPHGLFEATGDLPAPQEVRVNASLDSVRRGRAYAMKKPFDPRRKDPLGLIFRDFEFEGIRRYAPGDRLRDIDWKASTRLQHLMSKTFEKEMEGILYCLVDASRTMREKTPGTDVAKLDHAADLVLQVGEMASMRNFQIGLVVFDEQGILVDVPASRSKGQERLLAERILRLPNSLHVTRRLDAAEREGEHTTGEAEFLDAVRALQGAPSVEARAALRQRRGSRGPSEAVARLLAAHPPGNLFVFTFTDFGTDPHGVTQGLLRLVERSHQVAAGLLPATSYLGPPRPPPLRDLENAYREVRARERAMALLAARGVRTVELDPRATVSRMVDA